jgi:hypothetical protein
MHSSLISMGEDWMVQLTAQDLLRIGEGARLHLRAKDAPLGDYEPAVLVSAGEGEIQRTPMCTFVPIKPEEIQRLLHEPFELLPLAPGWLLASFA